jgi:hypothetical protein
MMIKIRILTSATTTQGQFKKAGPRRPPLQIKARVFEIKAILNCSLATSLTDKEGSRGPSKELQSPQPSLITLRKWRNRCWLAIAQTILNYSLRTSQGLEYCTRTVYKSRASLGNSRENLFRSLSPSQVFCRARKYLCILWKTWSSLPIRIDANPLGFNSRRKRPRFSSLESQSLVLEHSRLRGTKPQVSFKTSPCQQGSSTANSQKCLEPGSYLSIFIPSCLSIYLSIYPPNHPSAPARLTSKYVMYVPEFPLLNSTQLATDT